MQECSVDLWGTQVKVRVADDGCLLYQGSAILRVADVNPKRVSHVIVAHGALGRHERQPMDLARPDGTSAWFMDAAVIQGYADELRKSDRAASDRLRKVLDQCVAMFSDTMFFGDDAGAEITDEDYTALASESVGQAADKPDDGLFWDGVCEAMARLYPEAAGQSGSIGMAEWRAGTYGLIGQGAAAKAMQDALLGSLDMVAGYAGIDMSLPVERKLAALVWQFLFRDRQLESPASAFGRGMWGLCGPDDDAYGILMAGAEADAAYWGGACDMGLSDLVRAVMTA